MATPGRSDQDLIESYRRTGNPTFFETLVQRHRTKVLRLVLSVLGTEDQADAEDVVQAVFLRVYDRLDRFRGGSQFGTWLHRIAYRLALDFQRTRKRRRRLWSEHYPSERSTPGSAPERLFESEHRLTIQRALTEVAQPYQTALRLFYWFELPVSEIAETLGVAEGTAKSYLHRGRKRFHQVLKEKELLP